MCIFNLLKCNNSTMTWLYSMSSRIIIFSRIAIIRIESWFESIIESFIDSNHDSNRLLIRIVNWFESFIDSNHDSSRIVSWFESNHEHSNQNLSRMLMIRFESVVESRESWQKFWPRFGLRLFVFSCKKLILGVHAHVGYRVCAHYDFVHQNTIPIYYGDSGWVQRDKKFSHVNGDRNKKLTRENLTLRETILTRMACEKI